ncbi:YmiA family putative membrane protein [Serratia odorifera]|nr:YmiA family putative membrane protein [Serratia odorifera]
MDYKEDPQLRRKTWLAVFIGCGVFWIVVGLTVYWFLTT